MNNNRKKLLYAAILVLTDLAAVMGGYALYSYLTEDYWFLRHENQMFTTLMMKGGIVLGAALVIITNILLIRAIAKKVVIIVPEVDEVQELKNKFSGGQEEAQTAEDFVKLFTIARNEKPRLAFLMDKAIDQIEVFTEDKASIEKVMRLQDISYAPVIHAIEHAETNMLKVMRSLIVDISIWNPKHLDDEERRDSYMEIYNSIEDRLEINRKNLKSFHDLLMRVRGLKTEEIAEDNTIQALVKALESTVKK